MEIRAYQDSDKEEIINLILTIQQKEFNVPIKREDQPDLETIPDFYQGTFWVATISENIVGTIALIDFGDNNAALRKMFVKKEFRGSEFNLASKLLKTAINWCQINQIEKIYLGTFRVLRAAIRFYEKNGFNEVAIAELPINFPRMEVDTNFFKYNV
jgi:N-acetylglutamate synthase-like GNAT family acetyltransferase